MSTRKEVDPFISISWNSKEIRDKWEPIRQNLNRASHIAEYEMIKKGYRHCDVYDFSSDNFDYEINWAIDNGYVPLTILRSKTYEGYGHRHYHVDKIEKDTFIYSVIADNYENAKKFHDASLGTVDHKLIGQLLGYPDCCIDYFLPVWLDQKVQDPLWEIGANTEGAVVDGNTVEVHGDPLLNRMARYFSFQICPFFTHSFKCSEAITFSKHWYDIMHEHYPDETEACMELLSMPLTWSHQNMVIYVEHPLFHGASNGFDWAEKKTIKWLGPE